MRVARLLASLGVVAALAACNPTLLAECHTDKDCGAEDLTCSNGICLSKATGDGGATTDAGSAQCTPACAADEQCTNGMCTAPGAPEVTIVSPSPGGLYGAMPLPVTVHARAPEGISKLDVRLNSLQGAVLTAPATPGSQPDEYFATLNLADPAVASGDYSLVAVMLHGTDRTVSAPALPLKVLKDGPTIQLLPIPYPSRTGPATSAFLRNETVEIDANIYDQSAGLSTQAPVLTINGMAPVTGMPASGHLFKFTFDGRAPELNAIAANIPFQITATNALGTPASAQGTFKLTRHKWTWEKKRQNGIGAAPALTHGLVILGSDDGYVYALRPADGSLAWEHNVNASVVGHVTAGASNVYAAASDGHVYGLNPVDVTMPDNQRQIFQCPSGNGGFGQPPLRALGGGISLGTTPVSGQDPTQQETLFAFTSDGYVQMFRQTAFPSQIGPAQGCVRESQSLNTQNDASPPVVVQTAGDVRLFFGDLDGDVHRVRIALEAPNQFSPPTFNLHEDWSNNIGGPIHGQLGYGMFASGIGVLAMREDSVPAAIGLDNNDLWSPPARSLPGHVRISPIITNDAAYAVDDRGNLQAISLSNGTSAGGLVNTGAATSANANAAPIATADHFIYLATGTRLVAIQPSGATQWSFEPPANATSDVALVMDSVSPAFSCGGMLYAVGTNAKRGVVYAIITDSTTGLASGPWVRGFHDSHNTSNINTPVSTGGQCAD